MYKCSLFRSYFTLFNSLNMSSSNMLLRRKTNAKVGVVEKLAVKRAFMSELLVRSAVLLVLVLNSTPSFYIFSVSLKYNPSC